MQSMSVRETRTPTSEEGEDGEGGAGRTDDDDDDEEEEGGGEEKRCADVIEKTVQTRKPVVTISARSAEKKALDGESESEGRCIKDP